MANIAFIVLDDLSKTNGTTVRARSVIRLLAEKHNVTIIGCFEERQAKVSEVDGIRIHVIRGFNLKNWMSANFPVILKLFLLILWNLKIGLTLLKEKFDVVYGVDEFYGFPAIFFVSKLKKYKIILEAHGIRSEEGKESGYGELRYKLDNKLEKFDASHSDYIVALSKNIYDFYRRYNDKIELIPVFVDTASITKRARQKSEFPVIGLIGPFGGLSRQMYYLNFLYDNIEYFNKRIKFKVIGYCEKHLEHVNIQYTGYLPSFNAYLEQIETLTAVMVPEGIATSGPLNKIIEPMSHAIPVFTTPKAVIGLYSVESGKDILVFEEEDLVNNINELVFDHELMSKIGENARNIVLQHYSKQVNKKKFDSIFQHLVSKTNF